MGGANGKGGAGAGGGGGGGAGGNAGAGGNFANINQNKKNWIKKIFTKF